MLTEYLYHTLTVVSSYVYSNRSMGCLPADRQVFCYSTIFFLIIPLEFSSFNSRIYTPLDKVLASIT